MCRVDPEQLLEEAPEAVVRDVQGKECRTPDAEVLVDRQQDPHPDEVVDELVEEGRMERRVVEVAGRTVRRVDLEPPRKLCGLPEELLVEPVPPAADALREQKPGGDR